MTSAWDAAEQAARALEAAWQHGEPCLEEFWARFAPDRCPTVLAALVKVDIRCRFARGMKPAVDDYLKRFPELTALTDRVVSLIYEEYCLREERGEPLDPERFCDRYEPWRDSLQSQLRYHHLLSQVAGKSPLAARFPKPGERFQSFHLRSMLGQGGVARVYLANDEKLGGREVALKVSTDRGKEAEFMGRLDHPHIVPVLSVADEPETGLRGLCMPYRSGLPLDEVLRRIGPGSHPRHARGLWDVVAPSGAASASPRPPTPARRGRVPGDGASADGSVERSATLSPGWEGFPVRGSYAEGVAWIILTLARALEHAHSRDILHLDVKPANVLLTRRDGPQLLDFNLAHEPHAADQAEVALRGGTLPYMAPEQLEAFLDPDRRDAVGEPADLYSLGLLLRELLTGRLPEVPDPKLPLDRAIREMLDLRARPSPSLRTLNPTIPHALDAIAGRCLSLSPAQRYRDARELADDLERFLAHRPLRHAPNISKSEVARNWFRRNPRRVAVTAVMLLVTSTLLTRPVLQYVLPIEYHWEHRQLVSFYTEKEFAKAYEAAVRLARWYPRSPLPLLYRGLTQEKLGKPKDAAAAFEEARKLRGAEDVFRHALKVQPDSTSLHLGLAIILDNDETWRESERVYREALSLDPKLDQAYRGLAHIADAHKDDRKGFYDYMNKAVDCAESRFPKINADVLAELYLDRALAAVKWVEHPKASKLADERFLLQHANHDLGLAQEQSDSIQYDPAKRFQYCRRAINIKLAGR